MDKPSIQEVIIVEGRDDTRRLKEVVQCETIETNGSAINETVMGEIAVALSTRGAIVLTDPDYPGKQIRHKIRKRFPDIKEAFVDRRQAKSNKGKFGVEHADDREILRALSIVLSNAPNAPDIYSAKDMNHYKLSGHPRSKKLRESVCTSLGIEYSNGKELRNKLNRYQIPIDTLEAILEKVGGEY